MNVIIDKASNELEIFLGASTVVNDIDHFLDFQAKILKSISKVSDPGQLRRSASFLKHLTSWGTQYYQDFNDGDDATIGFDPYGYFKEIFTADKQWIRVNSIKTIVTTSEVRNLTNEELSIGGELIELVKSSIRYSNPQTRHDRLLFADAVQKSHYDWFRAMRTYEIDDLPYRLKAITWALSQWARNASAYAVGATIPSFGQAVREFSGNYTCNRFVGDAYAIGAGVGYAANGDNGKYPTGVSQIPFDPRPGYPVDANELASDSTTKDILKNLPLTNDPKIGDIISFRASTSHTGLVFGNNIYISAREGDGFGDQVNKWL